MPNLYQFAFLASTFFTFATLIFLMSFIVNTPFFGTLDLVAVVSSPAFLFTAVIVVATGFYSNVLHTGLCLYPVINLSTTTSS